MHISYLEKSSETREIAIDIKKYGYMHFTVKASHKVAKFISKKRSITRIDVNIRIHCGGRRLQAHNATSRKGHMNRNNGIHRALCIHVYLVPKRYG